jgi:hypothetical protein
MNPAAHYSVGDLFNTEQLALADKIMRETVSGSERTKRLALEVVTPALPHINKITGQQNDTSYFAYALEWAFNQAGKQ